MWAYIVRRLLWMIPTFLGILVINFAVLRMQGPSLSRELTKATGGESGEMNAKLVSSGVEAYLVRFRTTGLDLPALINLRGFLGKDDVAAWLRETERGPGVDDSTRDRREKELWMAGRFLVAPLAAVLADDALAELHGPASMALSLCAFYPLHRGELERMAVDEARARGERNQALKGLRIAYANDRDGGFRTTDPEAAAKRQAALAFAGRHAASFAAPGDRWRAMLGETGFTLFLRQLATGELWSTERQQYVFSLIADRWQTSFGLNLLAILIAWMVSIPLGVRAARRAGSLEDRASGAALFLLWSLPSFFVGTLLLHHLCTDHPGSAALFPNRGLSSPDSLWYSTPAYLADLAWHAALPLLVLCYGSFTALSRYMRASVLDQMSSDYVRTARAKGVSEDAVVWRHATRNSLITMITLGSELLAALFGGSIIVEYIFSIDGLGRLLLEAARSQDAPLVMGSTVISVGLLLVSILVADLLYAVADPRIRARYA